VAAAAEARRALAPHDSVIKASAFYALTVASQAALVEQDSTTVAVASLSSFVEVDTQSGAGSLHSGLQAAATVATRRANFIILICVFKNKL
jgi:hypothetical protein